MVETVLTQGTNNLQSEIIFSCNTILKDVLDPGSIEIEVMWFVEEKNVLSETFLASSKVSTTLSQEYWSMGQTVSFLVQNSSFEIWKNIVQNKLKFDFLEYITFLL